MGQQLRLLPDFLPLLKGRLGRAVLLPQAAFVSRTLLSQERWPSTLRLQVGHILKAGSHYLANLLRPVMVSCISAER